ncbi:MAG: rod shape-determining protein MreC [Lentisphaeria bacterium]|nr:rod shape-determining protein MreC [Lentisphaeria bacterium]
MTSIKKKTNISRVVLFAAIPVVLAALILTGFFTFRRTLARFSLDFYYPFYQAAKHVELPVARQALAAQSRQKLASAVEQLQRQNALLAAQVQRLRELEADNERLRQELRMPRWSGYHEVYAEVILRDPATWSEQFVISKGLNDGIETGDLVLTFDFAPRGGTPQCVLAGRVIEASARTSVVATVVNPACRLSVSLAESGANGTLTGNGSSSMTALVSRLPLKSKYGIGEMVLTSGFSERTPRGICVGYLTDAPVGGSRAAVVHDGGLFAEAWMRPAVSLDMIRFVVVLTGK